MDPALHGLRAVVVVRADLIRDTCGYGVPFMSYDEDRSLHARRFAREDDDLAQRLLREEGAHRDEHRRAAGAAAPAAGDAPARTGDPGAGRY